MNARFEFFLVDANKVGLNQFILQRSDNANFRTIILPESHGGWMVDDDLSGRQLAYLRGFLATYDAHPDQAVLQLRAFLVDPDSSIGGWASS